MGADIGLDGTITKAATVRCRLTFTYKRGTAEAANYHLNLQSILKDKHKLIALIMAPFLAIGGYGLADLYMNSREDNSKFYKLVPKGECKPLQDSCLIEGRGVTLNVRFNDKPMSGKPLSVTVTSMNQIHGIGLSILSNGQESTAVGADHDKARKIWTTFPILPVINDNDLTLRLAVSEKTWTHLGEIPISLR
ncbi:MAG: hypothetical protein CSB47_06570 [Proteobacteria bacterium]|nr:MAG: hypothetical protein CSB47_06570 [Pseudomonadota bacterium]